MIIKPNLQKFVQLAKKHNLIVLSHTFYADWLTPLSMYYGLRKQFSADSFLLESVEGEEKISRFSFLGFDPLCVFKSRGNDITIIRKKTEKFKTKKDPVYELQKLMKSYKVAPKEHLRFFGGFVGYLGYDTVRFYEPIGPQLPDSLGTDDIYLILPKYLLIFDHVSKNIEILSFVPIESKTNLPAVYKREKQKLQKLYHLAVVPHHLPPLSTIPVSLPVSSNFKKKDFINAVKTAKKHIRNGEIIQTVLSQRFSVPFHSDPFAVYRNLRKVNASPYMFYLHFKGVKVVGASPEMLLRCEKDELITRPIAGTRKRGKDDNQDQQLAQELLNDPKERAEHIMLVDLARNDLGRVAQKTTVSVPIFMKIEKFSHVMHIVSEVRAKLARRQTMFSSFISGFPAGTVSGAPKVRAMQIINELEPGQRGIYAGSIGYFSFTNSLDTCIIIRTIVFKKGRAYVQAGAGIVNDSNPESEYRETVNKAKAQILALQMAVEPGKFKLDERD